MKGIYQANKSRNHNLQLQHKRSRKSIKGLTLVETLIVLAIFGLSLTFVGPNIQRFVAHSRIIAQINDISAIIQHARAMAINHHDTITLCPSPNFSRCSYDWQQGIVVFIDQNGNSIRDDEELLLASSQKIPATEKVLGPNSTIRFYDTGANSSAASILICPHNNDATLARALFISLQGSTRVSKDENRDGVHDRRRGQNLSCI